MAEKVRDYPRLAHDIIEVVGGGDNIRQASRCATRLRLVLGTTPEGAKDTISQMPGVITVVESGGQFQVVIGNHVTEVYDAVAKELDLANRTGSEAEVPKQSVLNRVIATMSGVFAPFIYVLAAAGILQGALIITRMLYPDFTDTGTDQVLSFMSWTPFTFLPVLIAITASRHFQTNTYVAVLCCAAIMNPDWTTMAESISQGETISFLTIPMSPTVYTSSVLPPLILVWLLSYLERFLNNHLPAAAKQLFTPFFCLVIMVPLTFLVIGPLSSSTATGIANGYNWLVEVAPVIAGAVIGGVWQVAVIFGVHWGVTPMVLANFDNYGQDTFQAFQTAAVIGQVGAAVGVLIRTRSRQMRGVAGSAAVTGIFGITEPTIYGVTLRLKRPFVMGCLAGAAGAVVVALFGSHYYAYAGLPGPLTILNSYSETASGSLVGEAIGCLVAFLGAIALVWVTGFEDPKDPEDPAEAGGAAGADGAEASAAPGAMVSQLGEENYDAELAAASQRYAVASPVSGELVPLRDVPDAVFASGAMGKGVGVEPSEDSIYAPFDGKVVMVPATRHALGLISSDGVELLIHIGIDTVELDGKHFTSHVEAGQEVRAGDLLMECDREAITEAGYKTVTPVIVTNADAYDKVLLYPQSSVRHGEELATALLTGSEGVEDEAEDEAQVSGAAVSQAQAGDES
ncbi:PTS beta-glucoside transporter subunit EIIBCA [Actinomyces lilanjuaniae]|uniref:PTS beta-glucoside transporter subunit EIIBCA n=1 Tax=Actinomyces lilanjuaniae TaxID=2321394 RepID=A0ABM6Z395_9ACTO|nr:beta-glucoside-specific PTS transporter subunit IIABC [Actinomyces lilanjuaniae]AYD89573.1 PTS beta-glucoside transporter subunit EIIBCA [Actinomyces lilanjuaniae]